MDCRRLPDSMLRAGSVDLRRASTADQYVAALHFAMTTMATVGDVPPDRFLSTCYNGDIVEEMQSSDTALLQTRCLCS